MHACVCVCVFGVRAREVNVLSALGVRGKTTLSDVGIRGLQPQSRQIRYHS